MNNQLNDINFRRMLNFETVIAKPIPQNVIQTREQGKQTFKYISGEQTNAILREATLGIGYDFRITKQELVNCVPKPIKAWDNKTKKFVPSLDQNGNQIYENQPPFASVTAVLTIPGLGSREQCGSSVLTGGASEQESCFKGATTDAFKKCCSSFGVASELYTREPIYRFELTQDQRQLVTDTKNKLNLTGQQLTNAIAEFLLNPSANQLYIMPCNVHFFIDWLIQKYDTVKA